MAIEIDKFFDFAENPAASGAWPEQIGRLIINFGSVELAVLKLIHVLAHDVVVHDLAVDMQLGKRIGLARKLIGLRNPPREMVLELEDLLKTVDGMSEVRNTIAHNPVVLGWKDRPAEGDPDYIMVPKLKRVLKGDGKGVRYSLRSIQTTVDYAAKVVKALHALMPKLEAAIEAERKPAPKPN